MPVTRSHLIPLAAAVLFPSTFLLTYVWAVYLGHTDPVWPYISDTGALPPESCVFGQLLNIGALLLWLTFYIRYKQVAAHYPGHKKQVVLKQLNKIGLWCGSLGSLGLSMVANFQEISLVTVHFLGACLCFLFGNFYLWVQVYLSSYLRPPIWPCFISSFRAFLAILHTLSLASTVVFLFLAKHTSGEENLQLHWKQREGMGFHIASTTSEWLMAAAFCFFIISFVPDFQTVGLEAHCRSPEEISKRGPITFGCSNANV